MESLTRSSQTALLAAAARAAHLIVDAEPYIFADTLAATLLDDRADEFIDYHRNHGRHVVLAGARAQVICRSRYAEGRVSASRADQYVILGAGLDSFAYRSTSPMRVFEVDHPATQALKRDNLARAGIAVPDTARFVPVDFETDDLVRQLVAAGFDRYRPAVVAWLGVTMYLTRAAISQTLAVIGNFTPGSELIVDHMLPTELRDEAGQTYVDLVAPGAAERGEPWLSFLAPADMSALLSGSGFTDVRHANQRDAIDAPLWNRTDVLRPAALSMLTRATVAG
jgi:methyltransferase (TIGR00027 family)